MNNMVEPFLGSARLGNNLLLIDQTIAGVSGADSFGKKFMERLGSLDVRSAGRQWDAFWDDGNFFKAGFNTQGV